MLYIKYIMLNKNINMLNKQWHYVDFSYYNKDNLPNASGVYFFAKVNRRVLNVPVGLEIVYIGKSKDLQKRFNHYSGYREYRNSRKVHNNDLGLFLKTERNLEFWYLETEIDEISIYERLLTKEFNKFNNNLTNKIKFKTKEGELYV